MNAVHPVVTVRGKLVSWKPGDNVQLELEVELTGDAVGRATLSYLTPTLVDMKNPALGVVGYHCEDTVRPHKNGGFKWTGTVPKKQALTLVVWSRFGHMATVPLFHDVAVEGSFLLKDKQVTLSFPA